MAFIASFALGRGISILKNSVCLAEELRNIKHPVYVKPQLQAQCVVDFLFVCLS